MSKIIRGRGFWNCDNSSTGKKQSCKGFRNWSPFVTSLTGSLLCAFVSVYLDFLRCMLWATSFWSLLNCVTHHYNDQIAWLSLRQAIAMEKVDASSSGANGGILPEARDYSHFSSLQQHVSHVLVCMFLLMLLKRTTEPFPFGYNICRAANL